MGLLGKIRGFLARDLFALDLDRLSPARGLAVQLLRAVVLAARGIRRNRLGVWASSLTYITLVTLVPFLALVVAVGASLGVPGKAVESLTAEIPEEQLDFLRDAATSLELADFRALGVVAVVLLLWAVVRALSRIEGALNEVFGVERARSLLRRLRDYLLIAVLGPLVAFAALALSTRFLSSAFVRRFEELPGVSVLVKIGLLLTPFLLVFATLALLYWRMPATRVRVRAALIGAFTAALLWVLLQKAYFGVQGSVNRLGAVYGAFVAIPIFLIWVYTSWTVVLLGAEVCHGTQHAGSLVHERAGLEPGARARERLGLRVALLLAARRGEGGAPGVDEMAVALGAPLRIVRGVLRDLVRGALVEGRESGWRLAREPSAITAAEVLEAVRAAGDALPEEEGEPPGAIPAIDALMESRRRAAAVPLADLLPEAGGAEARQMA